VVTATRRDLRAKGWDKMQDAEQKIDQFIKLWLAKVGEKE